MAFLSGYLALGTGTTTFTELSNSSYLRPAIVYDISGTIGGISNTNGVSFQATGSPWTKVTQYAIYDAATNGNLLFWWSKTRPVSLTDGQTHVIDVNGLPVTMSLANAVYPVGSQLGLMRNTGVPVTSGSVQVLNNTMLLNPDVGLTDTDTALLAGIVAAEALQNSTSRNPGLIAKLIGANMNSTADQVIPLQVTLPVDGFVVRHIVVTNASVNLTTAAGGVYPSASKAGTAIVAAAQVYTALSAATKYLDLTIAAQSTVATQFFLSLTTGQGVAATADVFIFGDSLGYDAISTTLTGVSGVSHAGVLI